MKELMKNFLMEAMFNPFWILFMKFLGVFVGSVLVIKGISKLEIKTILEDPFKWKRVFALFMIIWGIMCIVNGYSRGYPH